MVSNNLLQCCIGLRSVSLVLRFLINPGCPFLFSPRQLLRGVPIPHIFCCKEVGRTGRILGMLLAQGLPESWKELV